MCIRDRAGGEGPTDLWVVSISSSPCPQLLDDGDSRAEGLRPAERSWHRQTDVSKMNLDLVDCLEAGSGHLIAVHLHDDFTTTDKA